MRIAHYRNDWLDNVRTPTLADPWRVLVSGCLLGHPCAIDGTDFGMGVALGNLLSLPTLQVFHHCPEDVGMGTPRGMPDIHGGDGHDVLNGLARVLDEHGQDLTAKMLRGAESMLAHAREHRIEFAILTDMSAACGSQVISDGCRLSDDRKYQRGVGVATALLLRDGIPVVSQRDFRTLDLLRARLDPNHTPNDDALDHHETPWYREYFGFER